jgi:hypothetical protein
MRSILLATCGVLFLLVAAGGIAYATGLFETNPDRNGWRTYENAQFGYSIDYPPEWSLDTKDAPFNSTPPMQNARFTRDKDVVITAVNFQGGWCESASRVVEQMVTLPGQGQTGKEWECFKVGPTGQERPYSIVRQFERNQLKYTVWTEFEDVETVRKIIAGFEFTR